MITRRLGQSDIPEAAGIIRSGGLVAVPTETVYGLAANGLDERAVRRIYEVKERPGTKPISFLVSGIQDAGRFCADIPETAILLAETFWPGPLTMVFQKRETVPAVVTAGGYTVGVRCPDHPLTLELLRQTGVPLAAPSANLSGKPSPRTARDVLRVFDGKIEAVLDGGTCSVGVASTILDLTARPPKILRLGGLSAEEIARVIHIEGTR